jgi:hypothetical protein
MNCIPVGRTTLPDLENKLVTFFPVMLTTWVGTQMRDEDDICTTFQ